MVVSEVIVECPNCHARNSLRKSTVVRSSSLEVGLTETLLICPDCGHEKHVYFMSVSLQAAQNAANNIIQALSARRTQKNLDTAIDIKQKYKNLFDEEQLKYRAMLDEILEKEDAGRTG